MKLKLQWLDGRETDEDLPIEFNTTSNGRRCSVKNPWPVRSIGRWPDILPGRWEVVGDAKPGLLVREVSGEAV